MNENNDIRDDNDTGNSNLDATSKNLRATPQNTSIEAPVNDYVPNSSIIHPSVPLNSTLSSTKRRCVCGSTTHLRRSHKACPLNVHRTKNQSNLQGKTTVEEERNVNMSQQILLIFPHQYLIRIGLLVDAV